MMSCPHDDAVFWNPSNSAVQCHRCGQVFVPSNATWPADAIYGFAAWLTTRSEQSGPFSRYEDSATAAQLVGEFCRYNGWRISPSGPDGFSIPDS